MRPAGLFSLLLMIVSCSPYQQQEVKDDAGALLEEFRVLKSSGQKDGEYRKYSAGKLVELSNYTHDTLHGLRTLYTADGSKEVEEWYQMGIYEGPYHTFYPNGQIRLEGRYESGSMEGEWLKYYDSGKLMERVVMHGNEENGPFVEYWENGNLKAEGAYIDGDNEHGELKLYDEKGELEKTMQCERGICHTTWKRETEPLQ